jgi:hypothetical protein
MDDNENGPQRPFMTLPDRPPLRGIAGGNSSMEKEMAQAATEAIEKRSQARSDALVAVARARARGNQPSTHWSALDADTAHAITDLLLQIQNAPASMPDPAFRA